MSITVNKPKNTNYLQPTKFLLSFSDVSDAVYFCQQVNLPGLSVAEVAQPTPHANLFKQGTKVNYSNLDITFMVNEDLSAWTTIHDWMRDNSINEKYRNVKVDATLTILSNLNNPRIRITYRNVFPISLGSLIFDTTLSAENHLSATANFKYDYYDIEHLN